MRRITRLAGIATAVAGALGLRRARRQSQPATRPPNDLAAERLKQRLDESRERLKAEVPPPE